MTRERRMFMNNDDKLREHMKSEPVPEQLRPENIKIMLDNEVVKKKRSGISMASRIAAMAAACAVISGTAVYTLNNRKINNKYNKDDVVTQNDKSELPEKINADGKNVDNNTDAKELTSYMSSAGSYRQIYVMFKKAADEEERYAKSRSSYGTIIESEEIGDVTKDESVTAPAAMDDAGVDSNGSSGIGGGEELHETPVISSKEDNENYEESVKEEDSEHSETHYQEQDVLEADIVKTDGKHIYYLGHESGEDYSYTPVLRTADAKDGKFTGSSTINISETVGIDNNGYNVSVMDMYVYNDMIAIIGNNNNSNFYYGIDYREVENDVPYTFVAFYTTGDEPKLIDVYKQDGYYNDVRISPEGYMLLTSTYSTPLFENIDGASDKRGYIPYCGFEESYDIILPEDILLPVDGFGHTDILSYTVISSLDLNESGKPLEKDIKTLAGYTGCLYCSADNLYTAAPKEENTTDITRISISGGDIVPVAGNNINGYVKDQFSMSEYGGYFRVAATYTYMSKIYHSYTEDEKADLEWILEEYTDERRNGYYTYETGKQDTRVYVLDMDMNMVGKIEGLGEGEELKSANFSGDIAYVVTFRRTDPLYAVDLSNPEKPVLLDEFKINGFSTYMQQWGDGLLLGFGQDANETGRVTGVRMTMFDNSDPNNLKAEDVYTWTGYSDNRIFGDDTVEVEEEWYSSIAVYERKALLIAPEKNLIGVPISYTKYSYTDDLKDYIYQTRYEFFSYEDGKFVHRGDISSDVITDMYYGWQTPVFDRAVYIGDYIYALSADKFVAAEMKTLNITDELKF